MCLPACEIENTSDGKLSWETVVGAVCIVLVVLWQATSLSKHIANAWGSLVACGLRGTE